MKKELLLILSMLVLAGTVFGQSEDDFDITQNRGGTITITGYRGTVKDVIIPTTIEGIRVTEIGNMAKKQLTSVIIPNGVAVIWPEAFAENQLTSVTIPNSVTVIGFYAFRKNQLTSVAIPNGVAIIGEAAFSENQLTSVTIPNSVTEIGGYAFAWNQLTSVIIPNSVTSIEGGAFRNNQLTSVTIPNSVTSIGENAFNEAFAKDQVISITLGANVRFSYGTFPNNLVSFYESQDRRAGTYTWSGRIWTVR